MVDSFIAILIGILFFFLLLGNLQEKKPSVLRSPYSAPWLRKGFSLRGDLHGLVGRDMGGAAKPQTLRLLQ